MIPIAVLSFMLVFLITTAVVMLIMAMRDREYAIQTAAILKQQQDDLLDRTIRFEAELYSVKVLNYTAR